MRFLFYVSAVAAEGAAQPLTSGTDASGASFTVGEFVYISNMHKPADPPHIGLIEQLELKAGELHFKFFN